LAPKTLSQEQIVDCWPSDNDTTIQKTVRSWRKKGGKWKDGANGGHTGLALQYLQDAGGQETEDSYPFVLKHGQRAPKCSFDNDLIAVKVVNQGAIVRPKHDSEIKKLLYNKGPVRFKH